MATAAATRGEGAAPCLTSGGQERRLRKSFNYWKCLHKKTYRQFYFGRSWVPFERVAREATFIFVDRARRALKKRRQIYELTEDGCLPTDLVSYAPTPEEVAAAASSSHYLRNALDAVKQKLSPTQRVWFARMDADVRWHGALNEARIAEQAGRSRAAASRAKDAVRNAIEREIAPDWRQV